MVNKNNWVTQTYGRWALKTTWDKHTLDTQNEMALMIRQNVNLVTSVWLKKAEIYKISAFLNAIDVKGKGNVRFTN